jgi:hypothetical protein
MAVASIRSIAHGPPSRAEWAPIERAPKSKRQAWYTAIRALILVALVTTAATLLGIAYTPQKPDRQSLPAQLSCTPVVVTACEIASAQPSGLMERSTTAVPSGSGDGVGNHPIEKLERERRPIARTPQYRSAGKTIALKEGPPGGWVRHGSAAIPKKSPDAFHALAEARPYPSPFNDMHGQ